MIFIFILLILFSGSDQWTCQFDYEQICFKGLQTNSFILLNQTNEELRQPASDVTAIRNNYSLN
jgi:hypothetical protein